MSQNDPPKQGGRRPAKNVTEGLARLDEAEVAPNPQVPTPAVLPSSEYIDPDWKQRQRDWSDQRAG